METPSGGVRALRWRIGIALVVAGLLGAVGLVAVQNLSGSAQTSPVAEGAAVPPPELPRRGAEGTRDALAPSSVPPTWPTTPPAQICDNASVLGNGPTAPPSGAITVPAGDNSGLFFDLMVPATTFWFAPGVHTLGTGEFSQIIPGDDSTFIGAPGAIIDGQNLNLLAFTQQARGVTIQYLEIRNFGLGQTNNDQGVVNHGGGADWTIEYNYIHDNDGAGVILGSGARVRHNCLRDNGQYGFSAVADGGPVDVVLDHNEITGNNTDDWDRIRPDGCGCTGGGKFWETSDAVVTNNWVYDNRGTGIWIDYNNVGFLIEGNYIENNDNEGIFYEISYNFVIRNNLIRQNALVKGRGFAEAGDPFPAGGIYISEAGGDTRAGNIYTTSEITGNLLENNWDGIALWENADRFCRPGETFDTTNTCPPFDQTWGTRYRTQNITIHDNEFRFDPAVVGCDNAYCGRMAIFSNFGSSPENSPYLGYVVPWGITFQQNNVFHSNRYFGEWGFGGFQTTNPDNSVVTWEEWTAPAPPVPATFDHDNRPETYGQDAGSTIR